jgi:zinc/manganese transport system substrate-binding protein
MTQRLATKSGVAWEGKTMSRVTRLLIKLCGVVTILIATLVGPSGAADRMKVAATFSVIGDMVTVVMGDRVELSTLVGPDGDTELYLPTLADGRTVADARVLFMNGLNDEFEPWLEGLLRQAHFNGTKVVVSRGAKTLEADDELTPTGKPKAAVIDQHAWLDPKNGIVYVKNIADALARTDPGNAAEYHQRAAAYTKELQELNSWAKAELAAVPTAKRRMITSHDSLRYLARALGITLISVNGWTNKSEPSAAELAQLTDQIKREHIRALFLDSITDPRTMQRIAQETGAAIGGTLYGDALSKPGEEADTYVKMIRHDVSTIKAGLLKN